MLARRRALHWPYTREVRTAYRRVAAPGGSVRAAKEPDGSVWTIYPPALAWYFACGHVEGTPASYHSPRSEGYKGLVFL